MTSANPNAEEPLIDQEMLQQTKAVMRDKFPAMVEYFLQDTALYITRIEQALADNDVAAMVPAAHTAKSSCKQMGAARLSSIAKSIEEIIRAAANATGTLDEMPVLLARLRETYTATKEAYRIAGFPPSR
jgi:HPt (histidine-containing phosphotransfer) domain-containing protein